MLGVLFFYLFNAKNANFYSLIVKWDSDVYL